MNNKETVAHLRKWVGDKSLHRPFAWPTDACGYKQHIKFVKYRNENWTEEVSKSLLFEEFVLRYAEILEKEEES